MANPKIQLRHDTSTNWQTQNPVLLEGEVAIETDSNKVKIGNGTDNYNTLPYITDQTKIDLDYSNADYHPVNKSGDTMTGELKINYASASNDSPFIIKSTNVDFDTVENAKISPPLVTFYDRNNNRMGQLEYTKNTDGSHYLVLSDKKNSNTADYSTFIVGWNSNGNKTCSFSNTICCDGQYVNTNTSIASGVSINGSTSLPYTLNLPEDGRNYMVWIMIEATTGTSSGNYVNARIGSAIMSSTTVARATTRTASSVTCGGTVCLVVSSNHKIYLGRATNLNGTVNLLMIGYRRIGTNS